MPTYEYLCESCGEEFERFQSIAARSLRKCPACGKTSLKRLIGCGAGIIFKGSGFYETDYRSESYKKAEKAEKKTGTDKDTAKKDKSTKTKDSKPTDKSTSDTKNKKKPA